MTIKILTLLFLLLAASFNFLLVAQRILERRRAWRLRIQRLFVFAQIAEKFIEWCGLVPPPAGQDDGKAKIVKRRIANDDGGIFEPDVESIALREDFRRKWLDANRVGGEVDSPGASGKRLDADDSLGKLAYVLTCDGYIGPLPLAWIRGIKYLDRKGKPRPAKVEILPDRDPGENRGQKSENK